MSAAMSRLSASAKWLLFATAASDRRRATYHRVVARARSKEMARRRDAAATLPGPRVPIPSKDGFVAPDPDALGTADVVADIRARRTALFGPGSTSEKPYLFDHAITGLGAGSPLLRFALGEPLLTASAYLGSVPILTGVYLLRSPETTGPLAGSQLYHCDWEGVRQVKVFVACTDIGPGNGPLTAVRAAASARVRDGVGYRFGGSGFRLTDDQVDPYLDTGDAVSFTGPAGSVVAIDTSQCLHYGSRIAPGNGERLVVQFQYQAADAFDLLPLRPPMRPAVEGAARSDLERLVLA